MLTLVPLSIIEDIMAEHCKRPELRYAQQILAEEVSTLIHGPEATNRAKTATTILFSSATTPAVKYSSEDISDAFSSDSDIIKVSRRLTTGMTLSKLLAHLGISSNSKFKSLNFQLFHFFPINVLLTIPRAAHTYD